MRRQRPPAGPKEMDDPAAAQVAASWITGSGPIWQCRMKWRVPSVAHMGCQ
jgi:hypothetical protein